MGFFSAVKKFFTGDKQSGKNTAQPSGIEDKKKTERAGEPHSEESSPPENINISEAEPSKAMPASSADSKKPDLLSEEKMTLRLRQAEPKLSTWLAIVLDGVEEADDLLWKRLSFLLRALETPEKESQAFIAYFQTWLARMDYRWLEDFRSELQYRLALALDMEDEEDERDRLFSKLQNGLARTRARFGQGLFALISGHSELNQSFWEEMEELFIMAD
ncbi:MAG: signal recognition particle-docking protein FtsY, partial [Mailhella sp.]